MAGGAGEALSPLEHPDLEQEAPSRQLGAEPTRELSSGPSRPTRGQHVINHQDQVSRGQRISMGFEGVAAVLEIV